MRLCVRNIKAIFLNNLYELFAPYLRGGKYNEIGSKGGNSCNPMKVFHGKLFSPKDLGSLES